MLTSPLSANKVAGNIITMHYIHRRNIARNTVYIHWSHCCFFLFFFLSHIGSNAIWISCRNNQSQKPRASNDADPRHSLTNAWTPFTRPCFFQVVCGHTSYLSFFSQAKFLEKQIYTENRQFFRSICKKTQFFFVKSVNNANFSR